MSFIYTVIFAGCYAFTALATPLQHSSILQVSSPSNLTDLNLLFPFNRSASEVTTSGENALLIECDGARYGRNPNLADCEGARSIINPDSEQMNFGDRHTGLPDDTFPLPYVVMGDKAECYYEVQNVGTGATARGSLNQVRGAANALLLRCASNVPSDGGIARNIGGDNNLAVLLRVYEPKVQCRGEGTFQSAGSCRDVLADMPASKDFKVFGPDDYPFVEEKLPQAVVSHDDRCLVTLYSTGGSDVAAWYDIWKAVEATFAKCARFFRGGSYRGLGVAGNIFLTLGPNPPRLAMNASLADH